ncbi:Otoancorin Precursor [Collichthys lucidus]|uniref:Otoancorin n=1 Tax=Collichthys lucidus TaxID=240159 RepID=A0A4U5V2T3_COLLU|nr:Otoancorin Precursor [Collichthys lucidus]
MDSQDYDKLLWAAKPALQHMPSSKMKLPNKIGGQKVKKMMKMLKEVYDPMPEDQKKKVVKWVKEQITQNYFNCTLREASNSRSHLAHCKSSLKWLNSEALSMMGPYVTRLAPHDLDSSPKEKLCDYFGSKKFKAAMAMATKINPSLAKRFLQRFQECFTGEEFAENVDKLGTLPCHTYDVPDLTAVASRTLLTELENCSSDNPRIKKLRMKLVQSAMSDLSPSEAVNKLGSSVTLLSPKQLSEIPKDVLKKALQNLGSNAQWTQGQLQTLVKNQLGDKKCAKISGTELKTLQSVARGLPSCMLEQVSASEILNDTEALRNISKRMKKGQLKAMLQGLRSSADPSELVKKLHGPLLQSISLSTLSTVNFSSVDQVEDKIWSLAQAAYLAKKMETLHQLNYSPSDVTALPDSVCPVLLDKMEVANMSCLPLRSLSRLALSKRALLCLTNGAALSGLTAENVSRLGQLICELQPSQLSQMAPSVLNFSLQTMAASCQHIPPRHREDLIQLVKQTYGDPSDWSPETMEEVGPLLLLDDNATSALPNKPWMRDTLHFLKSRLSKISDALRKKIFDLTTMSTSKATRKKRSPGNSNNNSNNNSNSTSDQSSDGGGSTHDLGSAIPNETMILELGMNNVYWTPEQLSRIDPDVFLNTVGTLGKVTDYSEDQLAALKVLALKKFGPEITDIEEDEVTDMGCITQSFTNEELEQLPFSLTSLAEIGKCGWNESQLSSVWTAVAKHNALVVENLSSAQMIELSLIICGLSAEDIGKLNLTAFGDAVGSMDVKCSYEVSQHFSKLLMSAYGDPGNWTPAQVTDLGNMIAGLGGEQLASLDSSVFSFISASCIPLIPPSSLAALSVAQLEALGPDNAALVTDAQRSALREDQVAALEKATTGGSREQPAPGSGAPSLSVEGISAVMKPLLFLLTGFLLL